MFCEKAFLKNFAEFAGKYLCRSFFLIKLRAYSLQLYLERLAKVFSAKFWEMFQNRFFIKHLPVTAFSMQHCGILWSCWCKGMRLQIKNVKQKTQFQIFFFHVQLLVINTVNIWITNAYSYLQILATNVNLSCFRSFNWRAVYKLLNPFNVNDIFLNRLKTLSDVFRGYRKRPVAWNGLITI